MQISEATSTIITAIVKTPSLRELVKHVPSVLPKSERSGQGVHWADVVTTDASGRSCSTAERVHERWASTGYPEAFLKDGRVVTGEHFAHTASRVFVDFYFHHA